MKKLKYNKKRAVEYAKEWAYKRVFVATHTEDSYYRELLTYKFDKIRFIKIDAIRSW